MINTKYVNTNNYFFKNKKLIYFLTKTSTTYGAEIEPTCAHVEQVPIAVLRISVGYNSAVYKVTIE